VNQEDDFISNALVGVFDSLVRFLVCVCSIRPSFRCIVSLLVYGDSRTGNIDGRNPQWEPVKNGLTRVGHLGKLSLGVVCQQ
jgi:hypothetical protein